MQYNRICTVGEPVNKCPLNAAHHLGVQKQTTSAVLVGIYIINHIHLNSSEEVPPISHKRHTKNMVPKGGLNRIWPKENVFLHIFRWDCLSATILKFFPSSLPSFANHALIYIRFLYHFTYCIAIRLQNTLQFQGGI